MLKSVGQVHPWCHLLKAIMFTSLRIDLVLHLAETRYAVEERGKGLQKGRELLPYPVHAHLVRASSEHCLKDPVASNTKKLSPDLPRMTWSSEVELGTRDS